MCCGTRAANCTLTLQSTSCLLALHATCCQLLHTSSDTAGSAFAAPAAAAAVEQAWRQHFVLEENMLEVECPAVTPEVRSSLENSSILKLLFLSRFVMLLAAGQPLVTLA
jgi:hypothetical protein